MPSSIFSDVHYDPSMDVRLSNWRGRVTKRYEAMIPGYARTLATVHRSFPLKISSEGWSSVEAGVSPNPHLQRSLGARIRAGRRTLQNIHWNGRFMSDRFVCLGGKSA